MNDFHPLSFLYGVAAGAAAVLLLVIFVSVKMDRLRGHDSRPLKPQDWSRHAPR